MRQVLLKTGKVVVETVPAPLVSPGQLLVRVSCSCISPGTEISAATTTGMTAAVGRLGNDPATARRLLRRFTDYGLRGLVDVGRQKLNRLLEVGYSCAGTVLEAGPGISDMQPGERVACAGAGYANHAEIVSVPRNLAVRIPTGLNFDDAATVSLGSIALQGVRRAEVMIGERVGVIGLGFLGQLTVQLLKAAGCRVFGIDPQRQRVLDALEDGLDVTVAEGGDPLTASLRFTEGYGLDCVLLTAATKSSEPLCLAMRIARLRGRVVAVGDVGLEIDRDLMYRKELDLRMSTSYGPGRYDSAYEEDGLDYPFSHVRWTENRNMATYLELLADGRVKLKRLTEVRLPIERAADAYRILEDPVGRPYTVLLSYPHTEEGRVSRLITPRCTPRRLTGPIRLALVGAGSFTLETHVPNLHRSNRFRIQAVVNRRGAASLSLSRWTAASQITTDYREILDDPEIDAVLIATRHNLHAQMVAAALSAGKHVFVEKPVAICADDVARLQDLVDRLDRLGDGCPTLFVGFNRRYSPYAQRLRDWINSRAVPIQIFYRMNAGYLPPEHWAQTGEGGGRILGEACHIFDLFRFLTASPAVSTELSTIAAGRDVCPRDNFTVTITHQNGSLSTLLYSAQGAPAVDKEYLEAHADSSSVFLYDYRKLEGHGCKLDFKTRNQDKGHFEEIQKFAQAIDGSWDWRDACSQAFEATRTSLEVDRLVHSPRHRDLHADNEPKEEVCSVVDEWPNEDQPGRRQL